MNQSIYAPLVKADTARQVVYAQVLVPGRFDRDGHMIREEAIEKAAYGFLKDYRAYDVNHDGRARDDVQVVESFIAREGDRDFPIPGAWVLGTRLPDDLWKAYCDGDLVGYSASGNGKLRELSAEEVAQIEQAA